MADAALVPPPCDGVTVSFPSQHVLLVTLSRPRQMNAVTHLMNWQLQRLFAWYDEQPSLRCAVITGAGDRAFCAGSDLLEIEASRRAKLEGGREDIRHAEPWLHEHPSGGFAGISRRKGKKPIIAAVNGVALGGGFEIVLNADIVVASPDAQFGLPEARVGVYAYGGGLPRLVRTAGMQAASDIALTGRRVSAREALGLRMIQGIARAKDTVLAEALAKAEQIASISPDGIVVTRAALREAWETGSVERAFQLAHDAHFDDLMKGENSGEGLAAFREKRQPKWRAPKL